MLKYAENLTNSINKKNATTFPGVIGQVGTVSRNLKDNSTNQAIVVLDTCLDKQ